MPQLTHSAHSYHGTHPDRQGGTNRTSHHREEVEASNAMVKKVAYGPQDEQVVVGCLGNSVTLPDFASQRLQAGQPLVNG